MYCLINFTGSYCGYLLFINKFYIFFQNMIDWQVMCHTTLSLEPTHTGGQRLVITFTIWYSSWQPFSFQCFLTFLGYILSFLHCKSFLRVKRKLNFFYLQLYISVNSWNFIFFAHWCGVVYCTIKGIVRRKERDDSE